MRLKPSSQTNSAEDMQAVADSAMVPLVLPEDTREQPVAFTVRLDEYAQEHWECLIGGRWLGKSGDMSNARWNAMVLMKQECFDRLLAARAVARARGEDPK